MPLSRARQNQNINMLDLREQKKWENFSVSSPLSENRHSDLQGLHGPDLSSCTHRRDSRQKLEEGRRLDPKMGSLHQ